MHIYFPPPLLRSARLEVALTGRENRLPSSFAELQSASTEYRHLFPSFVVDKGAWGKEKERDLQADKAGRWYLVHMGHGYKGSIA